METPNKQRNKDQAFEDNGHDSGSERNDGQQLKTRDDKPEQNIDSDKSITRTREEAENKKGDKLEDQTGEEENGPDDDAMNYKSDRDHGTYNPENI
ncbi:hypothetical protein [Pedobacter sp. V48]|uniref:hypothetical protein n=1 Tax=Pedobacter sp. V48 TaxID=509635 RepID=UPI0003E51BB6|nr:hypothetical protein [Pedobacter sp. V48]ETZ23090.1 hypothetical protein N824_20860 [Pedobacter sp. V48]